MWLLPSRGREQMCQQALDAFAQHGSTPGVLYVHASTYGEMSLPDGWTRKNGDEWQAAQMNWLFSEYPDEPWYGWIADDNFPQTPGFDKALIEAAGNNRMIWCNGATRKTPAKWDSEKSVPSHIPSCMMWGGDLVRAAGWWAPPWVTHATIDETWKVFCMETGRAGYLHNVVVRHLRAKEGRQRDATDKAPRPFFSPDMGKFKAWRESGGVQKLNATVTSYLSERASP